jgi:hypothetical protein
MNHVYRKNFMFSGKDPLDVSPLVRIDLNKMQAGRNKKNQARQLFSTDLRQGENF